MDRNKKDTKKLLLFFSHQLTDQQLKEAKTKLNCQKMIYLPTNLQKKWSQIPPKSELNKNLIIPFIEFIISNSTVGDYILIQGDFGITHMLVNWCFKNKRIPLYSTTRREAKEEAKNDGSILVKHNFKHVRFRKYFNNI